MDKIFCPGQKVFCPGQYFFVWDKIDFAWDKKYFVRADGMGICLYFSLGCSRSWIVAEKRPLFIWNVNMPSPIRPVTIWERTISIGRIYPTSEWWNTIPERGNNVSRGCPWGIGYSSMICTWTLNYLWMKCLSYPSFRAPMKIKFTIELNVPFMKVMTWILFFFCKSCMAIL